MSRRILLFLACFLIAAPAWPAPPEGGVHASAAITGGALRLRLQWEWATPMPAGTVIACRARVIPLAPGANAQPAEASLVVSGAGTQCALEVPLAWPGSATPAAVTVIYETDAISAAGVVTRTGAQTVPIPRATEARLTILR